MLNIEKIDGEYIISVTEGAIRGGYRPFITDTMPAVGDAPTHSFNANITVKITEDMAAYARYLCSSNIDLGVSFGSRTNTIAILHGMMSSPIPIAPAYGNGNIPELDAYEISEMAANLDGVSRDFEVSFNAKVSNGAYMALIFIPDARGFNVELVDMSEDVSLNRDHPFVITSSFVIDNLPENECDTGRGTAITNASLNDARIYKMTKTVELNMAETLTTEIVRSLESAERGDLIDGYYLLLNEMFWRDESIKAERRDERPYVDHIYGVGVSGRALQVIPIDGMEGSSSRPGINMNLKGTVDVHFIYGDIRYPANPLLILSRPKFDIISDSDKWTMYGPTTVKYIGGNDVGDEPSTIFSWEGRVSASPKTLPQIVAQLEDF